MRIFPAVIFCCVCISVASCSDKGPSTCAGGAKPKISADRMSKADTYFMTSDFGKYVGRTLGELERDFKIKYLKRTGLAEPATQLVGLSYTFPEDYSLNVYFSEIKYTNYIAKETRWDFRKVQKETISGVKIKHYGSGDAYYCNEFGEVRL